MSRSTTTAIDIAVVGGGPAGLTAALYAGRNRLTTILFEPKEPGGQLLNTELIEDYPGVASVLGVDLAAVMAQQAQAFGAVFVREGITSVERLDSGRIALIDERGTSYEAGAVILTAGGNPRKLGVVGEEEFAGRGVSYCAVCDGAFFRGKDLIVVGGGDAALEEGVYLTRYANSVKIVHRRDTFRAQEVLVEAARKHPKVQFQLGTTVEQITGDGAVTGVVLRDAVTGATSEAPTGGVFIFVGFTPNTGLLKGHVQHDSAGFYVTDARTMMTSVPGVFAAGDVRSQLTRQITTAVGDATTAAIAATKWVEERSGQPAESATTAQSALPAQTPGFSA